MATRLFKPFGILARMENRGDPALGAKLKALRKAKGDTQVEVAVAIGVSRGKGDACKMAAYFGASLDFLASLEGDENSARARNELEAAALLIIRELPNDEAQGWVDLMMTRLREKFRTS